VEEKLAEQSAEKGARLKKRIRKIAARFPLVINDREIDIMDSSLENVLMPEKDQ
jgi:4-aminobutyrate aminotransferase-like enzyme